MNSRCNKRRALSARTVRTVVAIVAVTASSITASAFMAVDTSSTRPQARVSTELFAKDVAPEDGTKLTIETITDDNISILLSPPSSPDRPVLVDVFAPWCGPCKILDKILKKAQPQYLDTVDFCKWNVNDKENTVELKKIFLESGHTLTKLPSLIVFRGGKVQAVRPGLANEYQLDDFLERALPDVLDRTFDAHGVKMVPLPEEAMMRKEEEDRVAAASAVESIDSPTAAAAALVEQAVKEALEEEGDCTDATECWERVEQTIWQNRTVVPAMDGVLLPSRGRR